MHVHSMGTNTMGGTRHINTVPEKFNVISDNVIGGNHQVELQDLGLQSASVQTEDKDHNPTVSSLD